MGISDGYRRVFERSKKEWETYLARFEAVNLPLPNKKDFNSGSCCPNTLDGWAAHRALLELEGLLTSDAINEIEKGIRWVLINEKTEALKAEIASGKPLLDPDLSYNKTNQVVLDISQDIALSENTFDIVRWMAILELGFEKFDGYRKVHENASIQAYRMKKKDGFFNKL